MASSVSFKSGSCTASSSGIGLRCALYPSYISCRKVGAGRSKATQSESGVSLSSSFCKMARKP